MKHIIIFVVFFILAGNCIGQYPIQDNLMKQDTIRVKTDTVRCLMLVCDTTYMDKSTSEIKVMGNIYRMPHRFAHVWWQFGYEVYEMKYGSVPCNVGSGNNLSAVCYGWYREKQLATLDQNKKLLPNSIVIWLTKEIKQ